MKILRFLLFLLLLFLTSCSQYYVMLKNQKEGYCEYIVEDTKNGDVFKVKGDCDLEMKSFINKRNISIISFYVEKEK